MNISRVEIFYKFHGLYSYIQQFKDKPLVFAIEYLSYILGLTFQWYTFGIPHLFMDCELLKHLAKVFIYNRTLYFHPLSIAGLINIECTCVFIVNVASNS